MTTTDDTNGFRVEFTLPPGLSRQRVSEALDNALNAVRRDETLRREVEQQLVAEGIDLQAVRAIIADLTDPAEKPLNVLPPREAFTADPVVVIVGGWIALQAASYVARKAFDVVWERVVLPAFRRKVPEVVDALKATSSAGTAAGSGDGVDTA